MYKLFWILGLLSTLLRADKTVTIDVEGMTCPLCTTAIKKSLKMVPGVLSAKVKLNTHQARVRIDDNVSEDRLLKAIERASYKGRVLTSEKFFSHKP